MKKSFILASILTTSFCFGQNIFPANGSVGIGTTIPSALLDVNGSFNSQSLTVKKFRVTNDGVFNTAINSGGVASIDMGFDGAKGYVKFGAHTGNGFRDDILYLRGSDGNVGIGTTSPSALLDVNGSFNSQSLTVKKFRITNDGTFNTAINSGGVASMDMGFDGAKGYVKFGAHTGDGFRDDIFYLRGSDGNVGIATSTPSALLDIYTKLPTQGVYKTQHWTTDNPGYSLKLQTIWTNNGINQQFVQKFNGVDYTSLSFFSGNVGIGTSTPDSKLTVNGKIHAQEVKIDLLSPMTVPDYVFANDYKLKTLKEVESYINNNSHLPEIPSAKELEKNGLMLAEMNMALLKKIEELTLYAIEQEKKTEKLNLYVIEQNKRIEKLEKGK